MLFVLFDLALMWAFPSNFWDKCSFLIFASVTVFFWWWRPQLTGKVAVSVQQLCHTPGLKRVNGFTLRGTLSLEDGCKNLGEKRVSPVRLPKQDVSSLLVCCIMLRSLGAVAWWIEHLALEAERVRTPAKAKWFILGFFLLPRAVTV